MHCRGLEEASLLLVLFAVMKRATEGKWYSLGLVVYCEIGKEPSLWPRCDSLEVTSGVFVTRSGDEDPEELLKWSDGIREAGLGVAAAFTLLSPKLLTPRSDLSLWSVPGEEDGVVSLVVIVEDTVATLLAGEC